MIQDIAPHRMANEYLPDAVPKAGDYVLYVRGQDVAVRRTEDEGRLGFELPSVGM